MRHQKTSILMVACLALVGCAAQQDLSGDDATALQQLGEVAGPTSGIDAAVTTGTECWLPSEHLVDDDETATTTTWRVLCRISYEDDSGDRYLDTWCIGDFADDPMLDHCYRWTPYSDEPGFEDHPAVEAGDVTSTDP